MSAAELFDLVVVVNVVAGHGGAQHDRFRLIALLLTLRALQPLVFLARKGHLSHLDPRIQPRPLAVKALDSVDYLGLIQGQLSIDKLLILPHRQIHARLLVYQFIERVLHRLREQHLKVLVQLGVGETVLDEARDEVFLVDLLVEVLVVLGPQAAEALYHLLHLDSDDFVIFLKEFRMNIQFLFIFLKKKNESLFGEMECE